MARPDGGLTLATVVEAVASVSEGRDRVVAMGGGGDSTLLLFASTALADGKTTRAVFVDHGLPSSDILRKATQAICDQHAVSLIVLDGAVAEGPNLEERARDARYLALGSVLGPDDVGLMGHSLDDQAETVLMRLAHGAGAAGLSGIPHSRDGWHRPLLGFSRSDIRALASHLGLAWEEDLANVDPRFERVRVRSVALPALTDSIEGARTGLARSAAHLAADDAALEQAASSVPIARRHGLVVIPTAAIIDLPPAVAARVVRRACRHATPPFVPSAADVAAVLDATTSRRTAPLTGDRHVFHLGSHVGIGRMPESDPAIDLAVGASVVFNGDRFSVERRSDHRRLVPGGRFTVVADHPVPLVMRGWEDGDRIDVGTGTTPVAEVLRAAGVPAVVRPVSPVITRDGTIAAVVGVRTAAWATASPDEPAIVIDREVMQ